MQTSAHICAAGAGRGGPQARSERGLLFGLCALHTLLLGSYGIVAPGAQSLYLQAFAAHTLPWAWVGVMVAATAATLLIRLLARRLPPLRCLSVAAALNALILALLVYGHHQAQLWVSFVTYVWRDVYILVLLELFWMHVNLTVLARRATQHYGWLSAAGTFGAVVLGAAGAACSPKYGTLNVMAAMVGVLSAASVFSWWLPSTTPQMPPARATRPHGPGRSPPAENRNKTMFSAASRHMVGLFALVAIGHIGLALLDYSFSQSVQRHLPEADHRTQVVGLLQAGTNFLSFVMQALGGPLMHRLTLYGALAAPALVLAAGMGADHVVGGLGPIMATKGLTKGLDHSVYRTGKELLYLPLSYRQKTAGKAWIDIAGSRLAKAVASVFLLCCVRRQWQASIAPLTIAVALAWGVGAVVMAHRHRSRPSDDARQGRGQK